VRIEIRLLPGLVLTTTGTDQFAVGAKGSQLENILFIRGRIVMVGTMFLGFLGATFLLVSMISNFSLEDVKQIGALYVSIRFSGILPAYHCF
jgi:hypothetical protein